MTKRSKKNNTFHTSEVIFLIVITCIVSLLMGSALSSRLMPQTNTKSDNAFVTKLIKYYEDIKNNYYEEIDDEVLLNGALEGMIHALGDPFSSFIDETDSENFNISLEGSYNGIGIEIINNGDCNIQIVGVIANSPAAKAGLQVNDIIVAIDTNSMIGKDKSELTNYVKQNQLNEFVLTILRGEENLNIKVNKTVVEIPTVSSKVFEQNGKQIGYIYFSIFSNTTHTQFQKELRILEDQGIDALIIDVRENSGGHLTTAISIASLFMDQTKVIYQIDLKGKITKYYSEGKKTKEYPIVVLQNGNSASASELLSAALKESYGATIIGETSYGKGTVQNLVKLENGVEYKFTTKKWLTPNGNWIHGKGIVPDIEVKLDTVYYENAVEENDNQLQEAIRYLAK